MIDFTLYRARIGLFNVKRVHLNKVNIILEYGSFLGTYSGILFALLAISVGLSLVLCNNDWTGLEYLHTKYKYHGCLVTGQDSDVGFKLSFTLFNSVTWNGYMRAVNGNTKNCINVAHWIGCF